MLQQFLLELAKIPEISYSTEISERLIVSGDMSGTGFYHWRWKLRELADGVCWPKNEMQIQQILTLAAKYRIPITARGGGTCYVASCVPAAGGFVLDMKAMSTFKLDDVNGILTVKSGAVFLGIQNCLSQTPWDLPCVPSSAPSATVGGWFNHGGGIGYGSAKSGNFLSSILRIRVINISGESCEIEDSKEIALWFGKMGIFGIVTELSLQLVPRKSQYPILLHTQDSNIIAPFLEDCLKLPNIHSILIANYPFSPSAGHTTGKIPVYYMLLAFSETSSQNLLEQPTFLTKYGQLIFPDEFNNRGRELWENRYRFEVQLKSFPIAQKTKSPVFMLQQTHSAVSKLPNILQYLENASHVYNHALFIHGMVSQDMHMRVVVGIRTDTLYWNHFLSSKALLHQFIVWNYSQQGKPYGYGLQNTLFFQHFEPELWKQIRDIKTRRDPSHLLNPLKMTSSRMSFSRIHSMFALNLGWRKIAVILGHIFPKQGLPWKSHPKKESLIPKMCTYCGYCREECPTYQVTRRESAFMGGKLRVTRSRDEQKLPHNPSMDRIMFMCSTCMRCQTICPMELDLVPHLERARSHTIDVPTVLPTLHKVRNSIMKNHNPFDEPHSDRIKWLKSNYLFHPTQTSLKNESNADKVAYFTGCMSSYRVQESAISIVRILHPILQDSFEILGEDEFCCGSPLLRTGQVTFQEDSSSKVFRFEQLVHHHLDIFQQRGIRTLIFSCPGCMKTATQDWPQYSPKNELKIPQLIHFTQYLAQLVQEGKIKFKSMDCTVTYHDPCHLGRFLGIFDAPRQIIQAIPDINFVEMPHNRENAICCGAGGGLRAINPSEALSIAQNRVLEAIRTGAKSIITACPFCKYQLNQAVKMLLSVERIQFPIKVVNLEDIVADLL
jgi:Fe-S oxidoreductase/FAD/FMN-containing dehydrogenase